MIQFMKEQETQETESRNRKEWRAKNPLALYTMWYNTQKGFVGTLGCFNAAMCYAGPKTHR